MMIFSSRTSVTFIIAGFILGVKALYNHEQILRRLIVKSGKSERVQMMRNIVLTTSQTFPSMCIILPE
jgi:hypothetical protein